MPLLEPLLKVARAALDADAVTVSVRQKDSERLLVCSEDGTLREATGCLSLGLIEDGPRRLTGGLGALQSAECSSVLGFAPSGYLGASFLRSGRQRTGAIAVWSRRGRQWGSAEQDLLREIATLCARQVETAREVEQAASSRSPAEPGADLVLEIGHDGVIRSASERAGAFLLRSGPDALVGRALREFAHPDDLPALVGADQLPDADASQPLEVRLRSANGEWRWFEARWPRTSGTGPLSISLRDITSRKSKPNLNVDALVDPVTDLASRSLLINRIDHAIARARRNPDFDFAVVMMAIAGFAHVVGQLGSSSHDPLLRAVATRLTSSFRAVDTIARVGRAEFALLLEGVRDEETVRVAVDRLLATMERPVDVGSTPVDLRVHVVVVVGGDVANGLEMVRDAEAALIESRARDTAYTIVDRRGGSRD